MTTFVRRWWVWVFFACTAVASFAMFQSSANWQRAPWWPSALMELTFFFPLLSSALAGWTAWQGWRHRRAQLGTFTSVRHPLQVVGQWYRPAMVAAIAAPLLAICWMAPHLEGRPRAVDLLLIPMAILQLIAWGMLGAVLGRLLPLALSVPLSVLAAFVAMAFPEASSTMAYRHVFGMHSSCCHLYGTISETVILASLGFHLAAAIVLVWVLVGPSWLRAAVATVTLGAVFLVGFRATLPIDDPNGLVPRPTSELACIGTEPEVCLWPEQEPDRSLVTDTATTIIESLTDMGITPPTTISASETASWSYVVTVKPRDVHDVREILVGGVIAPPYPDCARDQPWYFPEVVNELRTWLWLQLDFDPSRVTTSPLLVDVLQRSEQRQIDWFTANLRQARTCGVKPIR